MSRLMMMGCGSSGPGAISTFYSQRVFDLFPQMATANSSYATHGADATSIFGSEIDGGWSNDSHYIEWTTYLPAGSYVLKMIYYRTTNGGKLDLTVDGGSVLHTFDTYGASGLPNQVLSSVAFTVAEGGRAIRLTKNGKNASSAAYVGYLVHVQLIKQDATSALTSVANVPHVINVPVVFADSHTNWNTLGMNTSYIYGTILQPTGAQNATITFSFWAPKGAATLAIFVTKADSYGIISVSVDGSSWGTIDCYAAGSSNNNLDTSLSGTLASTGIHTITFTMATKNASSSSYNAAINGVFQIRMTSITEPLAADLAPEVALFWPIFRSDASTFNAEIGASFPYHGRYYTGSGQNSYITWENVVLRPGTYRLEVVAEKWSSLGNPEVFIDGTGTGLSYDAYDPSRILNSMQSVPGITLTGFGSKQIKISTTTKNPSSAAYYLILNGPIRLIRTGA